MGKTHTVEMETKQRKPITATFGDRNTGAEYPLGVMPLVRAFTAIDRCRVVAMQHNANLVPPWERCHGVVQITKHNEAHHGAIVCLRLQMTNDTKVNIDHQGVCAYSKVGQKGIAVITTSSTDCPDLATAYLQSIAVCTALLEIGAEGADIWREILGTLDAGLLEVLSEERGMFNSALLTAPSLADEDKMNTLDKKTIDCSSGEDYSNITYVCNWS